MCSFFTVIPRLLDQLHKAALGLCTKGFPNGISPVFMKPVSPSDLHQKRASPDLEGAPLVGKSRKDDNQNEASTTELQRGSSEQSIQSSSPPPSPSYSHPPKFFADIDTRDAKTYQSLIS